MIGRLYVSTIEFPHFSRSRHGLRRTALLSSVSHLAKRHENWSRDDEIDDGILDCMYYYLTLPANERWYDFKLERCKRRERASSRF